MRERLYRSRDDRMLFGVLRSCGGEQFFLEPARALEIVQVVRRESLVALDLQQVRITARQRIC